MKTKLLASAAALAILSGTAHAQDLLFPPGEDARFNWDSYTAYDEATNLDGQTLTIFGPWRGEDQVLVESMLAYFSAASGVTVNYSSSENYEQQIVIDTQAGSPPDIAVLPQPGLIGDLVSKGFVDAAWRGDAGLAGRELCRRRQLGQPWVLCRAGRGRGALRLPLQDRREVAGLVRARELRGCGLRSARDDGRPQGADRTDRGRRRHAVVHRAGLGRGDRLARDRLGRGHDAAHPVARDL